MLSLISKIVLSLAVLATIGTAAPHSRQNGIKVGKAIYFLTNDKENSVVALPIGQDGMISKGTVTKTGGAGSIAINGATDQPGVPDALVGQSALTVAGNVREPYRISWVAC